MLIKIYSAAPVGIEAVPVTIEVHAVGADGERDGEPPARFHYQHGACGHQERGFGLRPALGYRYVSRCGESESEGAGALYDHG